MAISDLIPWKKKTSVPVRQAPTNEVHSLSTLQHDMDRLFDELMTGFGLAPFGREGWTTFSPQVDVVETDKEFVVSAELPGLDDKDVEVTVARDVLTIRGEKKQEKEEKHRGYYYAERSYGSFQRSIALPAGVKQDRANAIFRKGVLTVTLPKAGETQERKRIAIKS